MQTHLLLGPGQGPPRHRVPCTVGFTGEGDETKWFWSLAFGLAVHVIKQRLCPPASRVVDRAGPWQSPGAQLRRHLQYVHQEPPGKSWPPVWVPRSDIHLLTNAFNARPLTPRAVCQHFCSIEAIHHFCLVGSFLLLLVPLGPQTRRGETSPQGERPWGTRACWCPAVFLQPAGCP